TVAERAAPFAHDVGARKIGVRIYDLGIRRGIAGGLDALARDFVVPIALQSESIASLVPVHAKTALRGAPVVEIAPIGMVFRPSRKSLPVDAIAEVGSIAAAITQVGEALFEVPAARAGE